MPLLRMLSRTPGEPRRFTFRTVLVLCLAVGAALCLIFNVAGRERLASPDEKSIMWPVMGTFASITIDSPSMDSLRDATQRVFMRVEADYSPFIETSALARVNRGEVRVDALPAETRSLFEHARDFATRYPSYSPWLMPVLKAWGFNKAPVPAVEPSPEKLKKLLADHSQWDLGGIAKGYAVDEAIDAVQANVSGVRTKRFMINLGGNIAVRGTFKVGIENPTTGEVLGSLTVKDASVATSSGHQKVVEINGRTFGHIIDPRTGVPVSRDRGVEGVTVLAPTAMEADALSTALFVTGPMQVSDKIAVLWIVGKRVIVTPNMRNYFTLTDTTFTVEVLP